MTNVHERPVGGAIALAQPAPQNGLNKSALGTGYAASLRSGDYIRHTGPQYRIPVDVPPGGGPYPGGMPALTGILTQLLGLVTQLMSMLGLGGLGNSLFGNPQGPEQFFQSANGASTGDPHLRFNDNHFDSMTGHSDLLDSDSFAGGYQISTSVTQPGTNGVTFNEQATVSSNFGRTQVSLDKSGNAIIIQNGQTMPLASGQSLDLGDGEIVTRTTDGSVIINEGNGMGGTISTTLSENGQGVDVNTQAHDVDLGGDLVNQPAHMLQPMGQPMTRLITRPLPPYERA